MNEDIEITSVTAKIESAGMSVSSNIGLVEDRKLVINIRAIKHTAAGFIELTTSFLDNE